MGDVEGDVEGDGVGGEAAVKERCSAMGWAVNRAMMAGCRGANSPLRPPQSLALVAPSQPNIHLHAYRPRRQCWKSGMFLHFFELGNFVLPNLSL